jgi:hypothetical protein
MGRQVTVDPVNLMRAGATLHIEGHGQQGAWMKVTLSDGRFIGSNCDDSLNFDCRHMDTSANGWMEYWLLDNNVPYAQG